MLRKFNSSKLINVSSPVRLVPFFVKIMVQQNCQPFAKTSLNENFNFNIVFWNAGGLTENKLLEFEHLIYLHNPDAFAIIDAGSFCEKEDKFTDSLKGYQIKSKPRDRKISSGMIVGTRKEFSCQFQVVKKMINADRLEAVSFVVWKSGVKVPCVIIYNPPNNSGHFEVLPIEENCLVFGDFNSPSTRWNYNQTTSTGRNTEDFIDTSLLERIASDKADDYTFLSPNGSKTNPDLVLAHIRIAAKVSQSSIGLIGAHGHKAIKISLQTNEIIKQKKKSFTSWNLKKANWSKYKSLTEKYITENLITENSDVTERNIRNNILHCAKKSIPRGKVNEFKPFWNESIDILSKARDNALKDLEENWTQERNLNLKRAQAKLEEEMKSAKNDKFLQTLEDLDFRANGVNTHRKISDLNENLNQRSNDVIQVNGNLLTSNKAKATAFAKHYAKVSSGPSKILKIPSTCEVAPFSFDDLRFATSETDDNKSPGPDGILIEFIKHMNVAAVETLLKFLNIVLANGIPAIWRKAIVVPILKPEKPPESLSSYRPIALTSILCKVYEKMLMIRLNKQLRVLKVLDCAQGAFQAHKSSTDQAAFLCQRIQEGFNAKLSSVVVFVDFKAAYDVVSRNLLLSKLVNIGIPSSITRAVRDFLCQRFISVRYFDRTSSFKQIWKGLPQGAVSSTTLFNVMINDLCQVLRVISGVEIILYADDLAILISAQAMTEIETKMNVALEVLHRWTVKNEMMINLDKTKYQIFSMNNSNEKPSLKLNDFDLLESTSQTYLGVKLDRRLTLKSHVLQQSEKAEKRMRVLNRLAASTWGTDVDTLTTTYKTYILPVLTFGGEILICASDAAVKPLEIVQNKALRIITGAIKTTPIAAMEMITGISPLNLLRELAAMKSYERIMRIPNSLFIHHKPTPNRLPSKLSFVHKVKLIFEKHNLQFPTKFRRFTSSRKSRSAHRKFNLAKTEISKTIEKSISENHKTASENKRWKDLSPIKLRKIPRRTFVANFRRATEHDILRKHLARFGIVDSAVCNLCENGEQTSDHLLECEALEDTREVMMRLNPNLQELFSNLYWHVRSLQN